MPATILIRLTSRLARVAMVRRQKNFSRLLKHHCFAGEVPPLHVVPSVCDRHCSDSGAFGHG